MPSLFKRLFRKTEVTQTPPSQNQRLRDEKTIKAIEEWIALGPFRRYDWIFTANKILDIADQPILFEDKVSKAMNLIYQDFKVDFVFLWAIENNINFLYAGKGKDINHIFSQEKGNKIQSHSNLIDRAVRQRKHVIARDPIPEEDVPLFDNIIFPDIRTTIALPLISDGLMLGVLELGSNIPLDFRDDENMEFGYLAYNMARLLKTKS